MEKKINKRLRQLRKLKQIKASHIYNILGMEKTLYYRKEKGLIKFSLAEAKKISEILAESIDDIFFAEEVE
jgi:putative transcriptional regulator